MNDKYRSNGRINLSRRQAITASAGVLATGLAGCTSSGGDGSGGGNGSRGTDGGGSSGGGSENGSSSSSAQSSGSGDGPRVVASFFSFYDFARNIADGTPIEVANLVPTGLHGHGWEPNASITQDIIESDGFIHVGENFQPWADRAIQTLRDDNEDTQLINARQGVDLVPLAESLDPEEEGVGQGRGQDPHFWLDPQRAKRSVDNIAEGLVELAPNQEATLMENASTYKSDVLDPIDQELTQVFEDPPRRVVQLAAHNAFQYIAEAYNVEMTPLVTNLAASGDVKPTDITEAKQVISENDIRYIGAAVFETLRPAQQLIAETEAEAYFPVTPYAGVREAWVEQNWGYEEVAYNINIPTFNTVIGNVEPAQAGPDGWAQRWRNFE
ncbi:metal ABC transporter substrate-binding protein [Halococcus sp. IIIV-5B]|uniref:metal ABC transporter substrate-binding protein n=1 Tax=Halococcus sp. IIIV-5B TaxID=2321230 RepID=UPI000E7499AE|nr:metal ABC transporter substrate-binding protein [Halococcus sp. IIIV-5B]RJT07593.1 zinc ABC transporter substrate-binding protein [Halococcus sp. IIIV-5B]